MNFSVEKYFLLDDVYTCVKNASEFFLNSSEFNLPVKTPWLFTLKMSNVEFARKNKFRSSPSIIDKSYIHSVEKANIHFRYIHLFIIEEFYYSRLFAAPQIENLYSSVLVHNSRRFSMFTFWKWKRVLWAELYSGIVLVIWTRYLLYKEKRNKDG